MVQRLKYLIKNILFPKEIFLQEICDNFPAAVFLLNKKDKTVVFMNAYCKSLFRVSSECELTTKIFTMIEPTNFFDFVIDRLDEYIWVDNKCLVKLDNDVNLRIRFKLSKFKHNRNMICVLANDITSSFAQKEKEIANIVSSAQLKAVNDFARTFAHNFGNKFSPIMYAIKKVLRTASFYTRNIENIDCIECQQKRELTIKKNKDTILNGMKCLQDLSNSVKNASRDYYVVNMKLFDVNTIVDQLIDTFIELEDNSEELHEKVTFSETYTKEKLPMYGMYERFEDAITNLLTNAVRFAKENPDGESPSVEITTKITTNLEQNEKNILKSKKVEYYEISIVDNGPGIPPEVGDKVFEMGVTTKNVTDGAGIGLASAKRDISMFGGHIYYECSNVTPYRTTFKVIIPKKQIDEKVVVQNNNFNINIIVDALLIDENVEDLITLKNALTSKGITCMTATSVRTAMGIIKASSAKVIVLNPILSINTKGIEFLRRLVTERRFNDPKIFIFTNMKREQHEVQEIIEEFGGTYLDKTKIDCLVTYIEQYLKE